MANKNENQSIKITWEKRERRICRVSRM